TPPSIHPLPLAPPTAPTPTGSTTAVAAETAAAPPPEAVQVTSTLDHTVVSSGCETCSAVTTPTGAISSTIAGGDNSVDRAYGVTDLGNSGLAGKVYAKDVVGLGKGTTLTGNLVVFQLLDQKGSIVYELYVA